MQTKHLCVMILSELRVRLARRETGPGPPVKYFTDPTKAVLLLWIICVIYVLCLSCFHLCSLLWSPEGKRLTSWLSFVMFIVIL